MKLKDTVALVTGSNRGIGRCYVEALLSQGCQTIYAAARKPERVRDLVDQGGGRVKALQLDITDPRQCAAAAKAAGDIDLLINNAGSLASYGLLDASRDQLERDFAVNFFGTLEMTRAFAPALERTGGALVNVLTLVSLASMPGIGGYSASKAAAFSMTQALRGELHSRGVRVFGVYPGAVDTDMIRAFEMDKAAPADVARRTLDGVLRDEEDIFPDPMSESAGKTWLADPRALARQFASM